MARKIITVVRPVLNIPIMQLGRPLLQGKYSYLSKICLKQNMLCSHELYEVIETELVQDNLDPNAPEKIMWHNNPYWDDASAKKDACDA
jgi:hypothetical protein